MIPTFLQQHEQGVILCIKATPKASKSQIAGVLGNELKVSLHAPPADGQANKELIKLLSKVLSIPKSSIHIISGETNRSKKILVTHTDVVTISKILQNNLQS